MVLVSSATTSPHLGKKTHILLTFRCSHYMIPKPNIFLTRCLCVKAIDRLPVQGTHFLHKDLKESSLVDLFAYQSNDVTSYGNQPDW